MSGQESNASPHVTRLLLMRHAETAAPDRFHGSESDVALGDRGREQAEQAGRALAVSRGSIAAVYSSTLRRARETAGRIARELGLDVGVVEGIQERRMGPLSGVARAEGEAAYREAMRRWMAGDLTWTHPGGESYNEVRDRVVPALQAIAAKHRGETVVVVSHGVAIRVALTSVVAGLSPADFDRLGIGFVAPNELLAPAIGLWTAVTLDGPPRNGW